MLRHQPAEHVTRPNDFAAVLRIAAELWPDRTAFTYLLDGDCETSSVTFAELDRNARAIAMLLVEREMVGKRALLLYPSGLEFVFALFGCFYAGTVAIPAFPPRRNRNMLRLAAICADAKANVALTVNDVSHRSEAGAEEWDALGGLPVLCTENADAVGVDDWHPTRIDPESIAVLQYTSGSTGNPKGVMLTHQRLLANCALITDAFDAGYGEEVIMTWLPTYHDMGLVGGILEPVYTGSSVVMMSPQAFLQQPGRWLRAISRHRTTIAGGPNFAYDLCTKKVSDEEIDELDLSSWTLAFNGAEPVRNQTLNNFSNKFARCGFRREAFYPCYGMAEATLMVTGTRRMQGPVVRKFDGRQLEQGLVTRVDNSANGMDDDSIRELVGCGTPRSGHSVLIVDPESCQPLPQGQVGEIWVLGPSVGVGYLDRPEETAQTFRATLVGDEQQYYLRTGDLGFIDGGQLFVNGRLKDLVIVRGVNKYPQDIEMTVERADDRIRTGSAAAFAIERHDTEQLVIVAEVERITRSNWDQVIRAIRENVAAQHEIAPDAVVLIRAGSIPKTSSGKIQRHACRQDYLNDSLLEVARWERYAAEDARDYMYRLDNQNEPTVTIHQNKILDVVYDAVRRVAKERAHELQPDTNIVSLGLDSLERIEVVHAIETELGITFNEMELLQIETCSEVATLAMQKRSAQEGNGALTGRHPYRIEEIPEYQQFRRMQAAFAKSGLTSPFFSLHDGICRDTTFIDGRQLVNFSSYNYLGMSGDIDVSRAAQEAIEKYGTSVSASRLVSGERPVHRELERQVAELLGVEDAITLVGGHATNETSIGHLFGKGDLILHDALAHNSIMQGAVLSGAERRSFPHNDPRAVDRLLSGLRSNYRRVLIAIEGVYSMDGDFSPLPSFMSVAQRHRAMLMVDEAHSIGTMGTTGRGIAEYFQVDPNQVDIWMGTFSKSFGSCGGYLAGSSNLVEYLRHTMPGFVYSVGMPPANAAAALAAIQKMLQEPSRVARCQRRAALFLKLARQLGLDTGNSDSTPVIPVIVGSSHLALSLSQQLFGRGINVQPIIYPAVDEASARLRFFITSEHTETQIEQAVKATFEELCTLRSTRPHRRATTPPFPGGTIPRTDSIATKRAM